MKVYVETNPETIYSGRVKDEVKTTEIRMWFETDEEIEVVSLANYTKQVRKEVVQEIKQKTEKRNNGTRNANYSVEYKDGYSGCCCDLEDILEQIQGE